MSLWEGEWINKDEIYMYMYIHTCIIHTYVALSHELLPRILDGHVTYTHTDTFMDAYVHT